MLTGGLTTPAPHPPRVTLTQEGRHTVLSESETCSNPTITIVIDCVRLVNKIYTIERLRNEAGILLVGVKVSDIFTQSTHVSITDHPDRKLGSRQTVVSGKTND